ncbi:MAG: vanadium-dependent haloperoxidase [Saprospiraceae bacterium]|nr:vanadium-dependent haloperoxidase [Saprospiraceae bacterium]
MNTIKYTLFSALLITILFVSCEKDYPTGSEFDPYSFTGTDQNGGDWKPILLTNNEQIIIDAPAGITSDSYKSELIAMKTSITAGTDKVSIAYWGNNPIIRWNEIARELAAKYNLTPAPNADGSYPAPSSAKPDVYPYFPFAHPPYACRAFAYLSTAQFDGLIASWHYKYKFKRPKRASTDGMSKAQTTKAVSDSMAQAALTRFGWQWVNQESPRRPVGIAPFYGKLKLWSVPSVEIVRPLPPPAPGSAEFNKAADELLSLKGNLSNEQRKIANWWSDGLGTYTPPGHWNRFATDYIVKYKMNPLRTARVYAYLNMAIHDAGISCWDAKYYYHYPRPIQVMNGYKTILGTPNFPSYTSGHSSFSAAAATVLSNIFPADKAQFVTWAQEASESRIYGGIHFRFDCEAGLEAGKKVAEYTISKAIVDGAQ